MVFCHPKGRGTGHLVVTIADMADNRNSQLPSIWRPENDRICAAIGYARDHIDEGFTVERFAEEIGMSLASSARIGADGHHARRVVERLPASICPRPHRDDCRNLSNGIAEAVGFGDAENMSGRSSASTDSHPIVRRAN